MNSVGALLLGLLIIGVPPTVIAVFFIFAARRWALSGVWSKRLFRWSLNLWGAIYILICLAAFGFFWIAAFQPDSDGDPISPYWFIGTGFAWFALPFLAGIGLVREGTSDRLINWD
jgi:hypothetical protein